MHDFIRSLAYNGSQSPFAGTDRHSPESLRSIMRSFDEEPAAYRPAPRQVTRARRKAKGQSTK